VCVWAGGGGVEWALIPASILASARNMGEGGSSYIFRHIFPCINLLRFCKIFIL
jgi:hypothetical protein